MIKTILSTVTILSLTGMFNPAATQTKQVTINSSKGDVKFLDDIVIETAPVQATAEPVAANYKSQKQEQPKDLMAFTKPSIEEAGKLQFKYALLLNTEVEMLHNLTLLKVIDDWMGTRYRLGGTTKAGVDCSALMQAFFTSLYGLALPRTAKEQYNLCRKISRTELKEGDLVFFNTTGGVSHVGMYLQNNKFVHASSSGVAIGDLFEDYWMRRFIGVGRVEEVKQPEALISKL
jgi:hypothetical protein